MISRANKLLLALFVLTLVSYLFYQNPESVTVRFGKESSLSAPLAIILLSTFCFGVVFTFFFAFIRELKAAWRERKLIEAGRRREISYQQMLKARSKLALGEWQSADNEWRNILNRDPEDIVARVELSRSLEGKGELAEALKVIDTARASDPSNLEVLFRGAELNLALGNKTAAIDNLALILYHLPSAKAAKMARDLSESLDRIEDALEYQRTLVRLGYPGDDADEVMARLEFKKLLAEMRADRSTFRNDLRRFVKSHAQYVPAIHQLATIEREDGNFEESTRLLLKASKLSNHPQFWEEAARMWIAEGQPDRAVSVARSGCEQVEGKARIDAEIELVKLYLSLNMNDQASAAITSLGSLVQQLGLDGDEQITRSILVLKGRCFNQLSDYRESARVWTQLSEGKFTLEEPSTAPPVSASFHQPAPTLSTP